MSGVDNFDIDWTAVETSLDENGYATTAPLLSKADCRRMYNSYDDPDTAFRSTINMARYNFGSGEYKYFAYPLPTLVHQLREFFYAGLAPIANSWAKRLNSDDRWPEKLQELTSLCHEQGQCRPTPLMLRYGQGDYNCLHQDLYGPIYFPLQVVILLSAPERDYKGGELILVEQRPRMQSRPLVVRLEQGGAAVIPVRERPRKGVRGYHRAAMRHGVSEVVSGNRSTLGIIFHDAK
jgi:hypothetical protein